MKNNYLFPAFLILFITGLVGQKAIADFEGEPPIPSFHANMYEDPPTAYYDECALKDADPYTLKTMAQSEYGRDKQHVYYHQYLLSGLNPDNVKTELYYSSDRSWAMYVAYDGKITCFEEVCSTQVDPSNLILMDSGLIRNGDKVFNLIETDEDYYPCVTGQSEKKKELELIVDHSDPAFFTFGYNITPDAVYWYGKKIEEANSGSFEIMHEGYAKDKNNVFFEGKIQYGVDAESFTELGGSFIDKNGEQYQGKLFKVIPKFKQQYVGYNQSPKIVDDSLSSAISTYESKYPSYTPQPAVPAPGSPEEAELKKFQEEVVKAQQEEVKERKQNMIRGGVELVGILLLGGIIYGIVKSRKKSGK